MKRRNQHTSIYTDTHRDWVRLRCESTSNNTAIARQFLKDFDLDIELESVRKYVAKVRKTTKKKAEKYQVKRLFYDIETGYYKTSVWGCWNQFVKPEMLEGEKKIICISYKWQYEDKVHTLKWDADNLCDRDLVEKFIKVLAKADEVCAHNGDRFDMKTIRTRAIQLGLLMYPKYRSVDTLKKARKYFKFASNKLDFLGGKFEVGNKLEHSGFDLWRRCQEGETKKIRKEALKEMVEYCEQDVILLEDVYNVMMPYIDHNTNFAVLKGGAKWQCPECASKEVELSHTDVTPMGYIKRNMRCKCKKCYHISNKSYQKYLVEK